MPSRTSDDRPRRRRRPLNEPRTTSRKRRQQRSSPLKMAPPPELADDVIGEILLRLPPDQPACLLRASLVCKRWRSLVYDNAFLREYRAFHRRTPPLLGFFHDDPCKSTIVFVPTATMPAIKPVPEPPATISAGRSFRYTLGCRHGRMLFETMTAGALPSSTLTVWDPLTGDHKSFPTPLDVEPSDFVGAVLCAAAAHDGGCDHAECTRGPFLVVIAGVSQNGDGRYTWARVYSSETGVWGMPPATIDVDSSLYSDLPCSQLIGGAIHFFMLGLGLISILKYDIVGGALSVMELPPQPKSEVEDMTIFAAARDGELGAATLEGYNLHLWSWRADPAVAADGGGEWAHVKVIKLDLMIQFSIADPTAEFELAGFAQGAGIIFISVVDGDDMFTVDLKSGHISKISKRGHYGNIVPLVSFCTPDRVTTGLQVVPMMIDQ